MKYAYRREYRDHGGWEVWLVSEHTGDRLELIDTVRTERSAQALIRRLYRAEEMTATGDYLERSECSDPHHDLMIRAGVACGCAVRS